MYWRVFLLIDFQNIQTMELQILELMIIYFISVLLYEKKI